MATQASWQKNTGQLFLHEMMHLDAVGQPHIKDEFVQPEGPPYAYGPKLVNQLAKRPLNQGGGATRASTNADSYAWLANSEYFLDFFGYYPRPYSLPGNVVDDPNEQPIAPINNIRTLQLGSFDNATSINNINDRFNATVEKYVREELDFG